MQLKTTCTAHYGVREPVAHLNMQFPSLIPTMSRCSSSHQLKNEANTNTYRVSIPVLTRAPYCRVAVVAENELCGACMIL